MGGMGILIWAVCLPDITPAGFSFGCVYIKNALYNRISKTLQDLSNLIEQDVDLITPEIYSNAIRSLFELLQICLDDAGSSVKKHYFPFVFIL